MADVVFLVDGSTSIGKENFDKMKSFMISVVNTTQVGQDNVRFCTIVYSYEPKFHFLLNKYYSKQEVQDAISDLGYPTGDTYTAKALQYSLDYFADSRGGRSASGVPQMMFVITDGEATDPNQLEKAANRLHNYGVRIYGIGVAKANTTELNKMTKDMNKVFHVDNFEDLKDLWQNISREICQNTKPGKYIISACQQ